MTICYCCTSKHGTNATTGEILNKRAKLKASLLLNPKTLTTHRLTKISASDSRTTSTAIGGVAIAVLLSVPVFIVFIDYPFTGFKYRMVRRRR